MQFERSLASSACSMKYSSQLGRSKLPMMGSTIISYLDGSDLTGSIIASLDQELSNKLLFITRKYKMNRSDITKTAIV
jgi:hypothetical protein